MTEVVLIQPSSASSIQITRDSPTRNDGLYQHSTIDNNNLDKSNAICINNNPSLSSVTFLQSNNIEEEVGGGERKRRRQQQQQQQLEAQDENEDEDREYEFQLNNFVGLFLTAFRKSVLGCSSCEINTNNTYCSSNSNSNNSGVMEIGIPTNVRHVAHVTFDRFNGFLGLPVEFEPEVPRRAPSASVTVFGVSTDSMQLSFDTRGNSVPTILLLMQHRLYALGGLQAEGIFRINPDNGQEESVRDQLNRGLLPENVDVHSLAGLIKAWFRELPSGVLDCLSPEQVMQSQTEQDCTELVRLLPPTEFALLDWAINLMTDVAQFEHLNKMNARNIAMVFAPNMTHMADPLTALMHAVQVMNFLKTLIEKTLREREDSMIDSALDTFREDDCGGNGHHFSLQTILEEASEQDVEEERHSRPVNTSEVDHPHFKEDNSSIESVGQRVEDESASSLPKNMNNTGAKFEEANHYNPNCSRTSQTSTTKKGKERSSIVQVSKSEMKAKGTSPVSSMNLRPERIEAWR